MVLLFPNYFISPVGDEYRLMESESEVVQSCPTPSDPLDCSLPGSSIHGTLQARVLEWVAISFPKEGKENNHINEMIPKSKELRQEEETVVRKGVEPDTITFWVLHSLSTTCALSP